MIKKTAVLAAACVMLAVFSFGADNNGVNGKPLTVSDIVAEKWAQLSENDKKQVKEMFPEWDSLPVQRRAWLLKNFNRLVKMSPEKREKIYRNYEEWSKLSPQAKEAIKKRYSKWKKLSPKEKAEIKKAKREYKNMSPEERAKLREEIRKKEEEEEGSADKENPDNGQKKD